MSSVVKLISYDMEVAELSVYLSDGKVYRFKNVPLLVYKNFERAESQGSFFNEFIRDSYEFERMHHLER